MTQNPHAFYLQQLRRRLARHVKGYQQAAFLDTEISKRVLERLPLIRLDPKLIINVSSGANQSTQALQAHYPDAQVIAMDISECRFPTSTHWWQRWKKQPHRVCADTHQLPLADQSVDLVFSNSMLYQSYDMLALLQEWRRVLKPGGLVLFTTLGPDTLKELRHACGSTSRVQSFIDMHDIGDMLLHTGFADPVMDMEYITVYYDSFNKLLRDLQSQGSLNLSPQRVAGLTSQGYWQRVAEAYNKQNDKFPVTCEVIYGHAWAPLSSPQKIQNGEVSIPVTAIKKPTHLHNMQGTVTIVGDILQPLDEIWDAER